VTSSVGEEGERPLDSDSQVDESISPLGQQESRVETGEDSVSPVSAGSEFCFDEDVFVSSKGSEGSNKSRSEKRKDRYNYYMLEFRGLIQVNISQQGLRKLQDDPSNFQI